MTIIDIRANHSADGAFDRLKQVTRFGIRAMQYGRMMQLLNELSDEQLKELGTTRLAIPSHARKYIYE